MADVTLMRRRAERARLRAEVVAYLDEAEERLATLVRAALRTAFGAALGRFAVVAAAEPDPAGVGDPDDLHVIRSVWAAEVEGTILPLVGELFDTGALSAMLRFDPDVVAARAADPVLAGLPEVLDQRASEYLDGATNRLVGIGDTAWHDARSALVEGFNAGDGVPDLAARVEDALDVSLNRAMTIARTEVVGASNAGSMAGARVIGGPGLRKQWLATVDSRTRDSHKRADGQVVALDEPFDVGGHSLDYPGDSSGPAEEVINCRCTVIHLDVDDEPDLTDRQTGGTTASAHEEPNMARPRRTLAVVPAPPGRGSGTATFAPGDPVPPSPVDAPPPPPPAPVPEPVDDDVEVVVPIPPGMEGRLRPFSTIMAVEGRWTGDDRYLLPNALRWDGMLPLPFTLDHEDTVASIAGLVGDVRRIPGPGPGEHLIIGYGLFDLGPEERRNDEAFDVIDRVETGALRGVSIRIDDVTVGGVDPATVDDADDEWWMDVVEDARLRALSPVAVAAFAECAIFLDPNDVRLTTTDVPAPDNPAVALTQEEARAAQEEAERAIEEAIDALPDAIGDDVIVLPASADGLPIDMLVAAGGVRPLADGFADPGFDGPTRVTVEDEPDASGLRRVYGHLAAWGTCHVGFAGQCFTPPHSRSGYAAFRTGEVLCADGSRVPVGRLTLGSGHASTDRRVTPAMAAAHYDNVGTAVADVAAGEDAHGIWIAGYVRPHVTEEQIAVMRSSPLSGDWRSIGGSLDLVAALHVNVPGFPVPRARVAGGAPQALVASGMVRETRAPANPSILRAIQAQAARVKADRPAMVAAAVDRVRQTVGTSTEED